MFTRLVSSIKSSLDRMIRFIKGFITQRRRDHGESRNMNKKVSIERITG